MNQQRIDTPRRLRVTFIGEQDGAPERELKARLIGVLKRHTAVSRAYLAKVSYLENGEGGVALCLPSGVEPPEALVREVTAAFADLFSVDQHLDVILTSEDDEERLSKVCRPFYRRPEPN
jgi:SseB protein C-terminal domain